MKFLTIMAEHGQQCLVRRHSVCLLHSVSVHSSYYDGARLRYRNITRDDTRPGPGRFPPGRLRSVATPDGNGPGAPVPSLFPDADPRKESTPPGHLSGICCDSRCCSCAPARLPIWHRMPGRAPVPGLTGNKDRHVARIRSLSSLRSSYLRHHPGPGSVGPRPRHHRRAYRRAHHRPGTARYRTSGTGLLDHPAGQMTRAPHRLQVAPATRPVATWPPAR
jgi:hypothetical protein